MLKTALIRFRPIWSGEALVGPSARADEGRVCDEIIWTLWRERRAGRCEAPRRRRCRISSRSGNKADARPPPRPSGLRPAGPLALLLAPQIPQRVLLVARASPAGLGASSKVSILFRHRPLTGGLGLGSCPSRPTHNILVGVIRPAAALSFQARRVGSPVFVPGDLERN